MPPSGLGQRYAALRAGKSYAALRAGTEICRPPGWDRDMQPSGLGQRYAAFWAKSKVMPPSGLRAAELCRLLGPEQIQAALRGESRYMPPSGLVLVRAPFQLSLICLSLARAWLRSGPTLFSGMPICKPISR